MKKKIFSLFQLALGAGLITLLFSRMDNKKDLIVALHDIAGNWIFLAGAIVSFLISVLFCIWRWKLLLAAHDIKISFYRAFNFYIIGQFFNAFMLGAVGGDLVKALIVAKEFPSKRTEAVTTIFVDRLIGLIALVSFAGFVTLIRFRFFLRYSETRIIMIIMIALLIVTFGSLYIVFHENMLEKPFFARLIKKHKTIGNIFHRVYGAFHSCLTHKGLLTRTLIISIINHIFFIGAALFIGLGLNISTSNERTSAETATGSVANITLHQADTIPLVLGEFKNYVTVFPIIDGIASIPATPGGLGTREYATKFFLGLPEFNVPETRAITLSLLLYFTTMFWSLVGGIFYAIYVMKSGTPKGRASSPSEPSDCIAGAVTPSASFLFCGSVGDVALPNSPTNKLPKHKRTK